MPGMSPRVVLVTGANGGLGQAIARAFLADSPDNVIYLGTRTNRAAADQLAAKHSERCRVLTLDVISPEQW